MDEHKKMASIKVSMVNEHITSAFLSHSYHQLDEGQTAACSYEYYKKTLPLLWKWAKKKKQQKVELMHDDSIKKQHKLDKKNIYKNFFVFVCFCSNQEKCKGNREEFIFQLYNFY